MIVRRRPAWLLAVAAAAATAGIWLVATPEQSAPLSPALTPSVAVSRASIVLRHRGQKQAEIASDRVEISTDGRQATFTGSPRVVWFERNQPALTASGRRIVYDRQSRDVKVEGDLRIATRQGYALRAPSATWSQEVQVVELTGGVEVSALQVAVPIPTPTGSRSESPGDIAEGRLRADRVRYDARARVVVATGNVSLIVRDLEIRADRLRMEQTPQIVTAEGRVVVRQRDAQLTAPALRYSMQDATAEVTGGAILTQGDVTIKAPRMRFDLREQSTVADEGVEVTQADAILTAAVLRYQGKTGAVAADGGVRVVRAGSTLTGRRLVGNLRARQAEVREDVTLVRTSDTPSDPTGQRAGAAARDDTTVTAGRIVFRWDTHEAEADERVVIRQHDRTVWADRLTYSEPANRVAFVGRVTLEQSSSGAVTRLTCARLVGRLRERDFVAEGPLRISQRDRWVTGDRGTYSDATRRLVVTGNVVVMEEAEGRRLRADQVTISLADETFEAEGNVQTEFMIRPDPTPRP